MALSDINQTKINDMCPVSNEFSIGSRLKYLTENGYYSSGIVQVNADGSYVQEYISTAANLSSGTNNVPHGLLIATGTSGIYDIDPPDAAGLRLVIHTFNSSAVYIRLSTDCSVTANQSTSYGVIKMSTESNILELYSMSASKWAIIQPQSTNGLASLSSST